MLKKEQSQVKLKIVSFLKYKKSGRFYKKKYKKAKFFVCIKSYFVFLKLFKKTSPLDTI